MIKADVVHPSQFSDSTGTSSHKTATTSMGTELMLYWSNYPSYLTRKLSTCACSVTLAGHHEVVTIKCDFLPTIISRLAATLRMQESIDDRIIFKWTTFKAKMFFLPKQRKLVVHVQICAPLKRSPEC